MTRELKGKLGPHRELTQMPFATTFRGLNEDGVCLFYEGTLVGAIVYRGDIPTVLGAPVRPQTVKRWLN